METPKEANKRRRRLYGYKKKSPVACRNCKRMSPELGGGQECVLMELSVAGGGWCRAFEARGVLG